MKSKYEVFDRSKLLIKPLAEREHDLKLGHWMALSDPTPEFAHPQLADVARRVRRTPSRPANVDAMIGRRVRVVEAIDAAKGTGAVFVDGERWLAESASPVPEGGQAEIVRIEGTRVTVRPTGE